MGPGLARRIGTLRRAPAGSVRSESEGVGMRGMSPQTAARSRWLDWQPKDRMLSEGAESEPTKPSKPSSVGFVGATSGRSPKIEAVPPASEWPQSLSELAAEVGQRSGNPEAARREVWLSWSEWKAAALNRLFHEQGTSGQPGK